MAVVEPFIRNSDNLVKIVLTEDGVPITGAWTGLKIYFGGVLLSRTGDTNGVSLSASTGLLTIDPADLTAPEIAAIALLEADQLYSVEIKIISIANNDGAVFGKYGSTRIYLHISDSPTP